ncbi:hypothetical protein K457DRAFT_267502 [Linnemannia elongata AG-77]|uniref:Uncharacterized protein n=1 Tax=Linnemannia elongata AG-77 TaxID=1314771 RepID=A0A197JCV4_9FUNG|nr:hypothetical protein K457DRAFT_267502 [Linnemannia elongata AG-77]
MSAPFFSRLPFLPPLLPFPSFAPLSPLSLSSSYSTPFPFTTPPPPSILVLLFIRSLIHVLISFTLFPFYTLIPSTSSLFSTVRLT